MLGSVLVLSSCCALLTSQAPLLTPPRAPQQQSSATLARVDRALFRIVTEGGSGSGFQYRTPGYVLTNKHVVDEIPVGGTVKLQPVKTASNGSVGLGTRFSGTVRYKHPELDVAVIEIAAVPSSTTLVAATAKDGKLVPRGTDLYAHGFPDNGTDTPAPTLSRGMLSAHYPDPLTGQTFYLTDTALSPGSSGGPVTDAGGAVVGIATAVSMVVDGKGNSWGYVLPIKAVDDALQSSRGFAGLPQPFDVSGHERAIKACTSPDQAIDRYRVAAQDAAKRCASATDLLEAIRRLQEAVTNSTGILTRTRYADWNAASIQANNVILTRAVELAMLDRGNASQAVLAELLKPSAIDSWASSVIERSLDRLPEPDRALAFAQLLSAHASGVSDLIKSSAGTCGALKQAADALESKAVPDRKDVRAFSKALASLVQTRAGLGLIDPSRIDPDNADLPTRARQEIRLCRAKLQNCLDEWADLPEDCRLRTEALLEQYSGNPQKQDGDALLEGVESVQDAVKLWTSAGFARWGPIDNDKAKGPGHAFWLAFDEAPALVWVGIHAPGAKDLAMTATMPNEEELLIAGRITAGATEWWAFEARSNGRLSIRFAAGEGRDYPYELGIFYRRSPLGEIRASLAEKAPESEEFAIKSFVLHSGRYDEFALDASGMEEFHVLAVDPQRNDIDTIVLDPDGTEVARDDAEDFFPAVSVKQPERGKYRLRFVNHGKSTAVVDSIVFVRR
jgi:hypothetical protein